MVSVLIILLMLLSVVALTFMKLMPPVVRRFNGLGRLLATCFVRKSGRTTVPNAITGFVGRRVSVLGVRRTLGRDGFTGAVHGILPRM